MQTFPSMVKYEGIIRLKVAAICIAIDTSVVAGDEIEEEIAPYYAIVEKQYYDFRTKQNCVTSGPVEPHSFLYLQPEGNLAILVDDVLAALARSIAAGELKPVVLKINLQSDEIDVEETWIKTFDFSEWCATRNLEVDDMCARYLDVEETIVSRIDDWVYDERRGFEAPYFDARYVDRQLALAEQQRYEKIYDATLRENLLLKMGFTTEVVDAWTTSTNQSAIDDKPLRSRERNALLSIIAILCSEEGYDTDRAAKTATIIKTRADLAGIDLGETTIENHLKKIPEAITMRLRSVQRR